ncbi:MAG: DUF1329 domain-containing protein [Desulfobacterales bacterium]|nr:DUF1329 domain-containing protein [Desulfobacterales bacterium]
MNIPKKRKERNFFLMLFSLLLILPFPGVLIGAEVPSAEDVAFGKAPLPTIEELTGGKVKAGDLIDKNNIDLVKEFLTEGQIKLVELGQVMRMANHKLPPLGGTPLNFNALTEKNRGKAILNEETVTVWYEKEGQVWPGGYPFPEPKTAAEVMAAVKFAIPEDDFSMYGGMYFVNKKGKLYKMQGFGGVFVWMNTRTTVPPLGSWPGYEDQMYRKVTVFRSPLEAKGLGGFNIRFYDDTTQYDQGFYYHPAFKKTGRTNATTWMNNAGGTDYTYGDGMGLQDPMSDWSFKFVGTKYMLHTEFVADKELIDEKGRPLDMESDFGDKFPRFGYAAIPFHVIEATPVIKHIYGKKMLYVLTYLYNKPESLIPMMDAYDLQMKLWKHYTLYNGKYYKEEHYAIHAGCNIWDLQSLHNTAYWFDMKINNGLKPKDASLKALLARGR